MDQGGDQTNGAVMEMLHAFFQHQNNMKQNTPTRTQNNLSTYIGDRTQLEAWILQAEAKLQIDFEDCSEDTKFWHLFGALGGKALTILQPWAKIVKGTREATVHNFINRLRLAFGDPLLEQKALRRLTTMKQGTRTFFEYYSDFSKSLVEAGGSDWDDLVKINYLQNGLNYDLQEKAVGLSRLLSFTERCEKLNEIWDDLSALKAHRAQGLTGRFINHKMNESRSRSDDMMDWQKEPARVNMTTARRAAWVSEDELNKRRSQGLCLRCGTSGHLIKSCTFLKAVNPARVARTKASIEPLLEPLEPIVDLLCTDDSEN